MEITRFETDRLQRMFGVELPPAVERRIRLTSYADSAILKATLLHSREHPFLVREVKTSLATVRAATYLYGLRDVDSQINNAVVEARTNLNALGHAAPIMSRPYYSEAIFRALDQIEAELRTPLATKPKAAA